MDVIEDIGLLLRVHGDRPYDGLRHELVTELEHALQCAQLAEWSQVDNTLVAAALLHDIGHFAAAATGDDIDDEHEQRAATLLSGVFPAAVIEPVRLHVQAKRYLVATDAKYLAGLSSAWVHSLGLQGGPMSPAECHRFEATPSTPRTQWCCAAGMTAPRYQPARRNAAAGVLPAAAARVLHRRWTRLRCAR